MNKDKCRGAFFGAAIGDAMGGPVESSHYKRIRDKCGKITGLVPYNEKYMLAARLRHPKGTFHPGYALHSDAGSITDDTFCRKDITRFLIETQPPRTPEMLAEWLLENGELETQWPQSMVPALYRVRDGEVSAAESGNTFKQGGGIGWWFPFGILYAEDPDRAAREARKLCAIWKAPLERDFVAAVVAGIAEGVKPDATWDSMVDAMLKQCGPLATKLLERAIRIGKSATDEWDLATRLYDEALMPETAHITHITDQDPPTAVDAPLPPRHAPVDYTDDEYTTFFFSEQIPFALASFVYAKGAVEAIPTCVNCGRDSDTNANTVGGWVGALHGESGLPKEWVSQVLEVNKNELDLNILIEQLMKTEK